MSHDHDFVSFYNEPYIKREVLKVQFMREIFSLLKKFDTFVQKVPGSNPGQDNLYANDFRI